MNATLKMATTGQLHSGLNKYYAFKLYNGQEYSLMPQSIMFIQKKHTI